MFTPLLTTKRFIQSVRFRSGGILCPCLVGWRKEVQHRGRAFALLVVLLITVVLVAACASPSTVSPLEPATTLAVGSIPDLAPQYAGQGLKFERISVEDGLSQGTVNGILQDRLGLMWFCTQEGLNRYDGYGFEVYRHDPQNPNSLSHNQVTALVEDEEGNLWIATYGGGLDKYNRRTDMFTHYRNDPGNVESLADDRLRSLLIDSDGALWIGTAAGLDRFEPLVERFTHYQPEPDNPHSLSGWTVESIYQDSDGLLWIGTNSDGLNRLDPITGRFAHFPLDPGDLHDLSSNVSVRAIGEDQRGDLWIGTMEGLYQLDRQTSQAVHYQHQPDNPHSLSNNMVFSIFADPGGVLWIGTYGGGLDRLDPVTGEFAHYRNIPNEASSLSSNAVLSIYQDRVGGLWIGTAGGGISKLSPDTKRFVHVQNDPANPNSLSNNTVRAILEDRGVLWIGTLGGGLDRFDRETDEWRHYRYVPGDAESLSNDKVTSICKDQEGALWIGTLGGGLDRFDWNTERFMRYPTEPGDAHSLGTPVVHALLADREGALWIATDAGPTGGLHRFDSQTERVTHYKHDPDDPQTIGNSAVQVLYEDRSSALWIGTSGSGLNRLDRSTDRFTHYENQPGDPDSLSHDKVTAIYEDRAGVLWVGTDGGGLNRFNRDEETFIHYTMEDGLPGDTIYSILEEDDAPSGLPDGGQGVLWLSTNNGLSRFDPSAETLRNYDVRDGLQGNVFSIGAHHKSSSGEIFFGGVNGLSAFYPEQIVDNPTVPPVVLTSLTQLTRNGEDVPLGTAAESARQIVLRWPNNAFEFEFAALNFIQPDKNQHAYMLEGFDKDWNDIGNRRYGKYTNLPAGTYTLHMIGSNNDGVWNEEGASVTITIVPPFWGTWWFRGIVLLVLLGVAFGASQLRVRRIEARSGELEKQVAERTSELREEIDQRIRVEEALRQSEMEAAIAAERSHLARELHDAVTQTLFSASLIAEALPALWERDQEKGRNRLATLRQMSRGALAEMRTLLLELRPTALVETRLADLLRQLGEAVTGREGVPVTVVVEGECGLPADLHVALYRIAQEALNNVVKHAKASQIVVSLRCGPRAPSPSPREGEGAGLRVELCIRDDGCGFDPDDVPPDHLGLGIMRERAEAAGAHLEIVGLAGQGTQVTVVWPGDEGCGTENRSSSSSFVC
jgi:ligand-binding sensor domain-containing protein/signal transduction histidine kinase